MGEIREGDLDHQFDRVAFAAEVGRVYGPVATAFGFHLIEILRRRG